MPVALVVHPDGTLTELEDLELATLQEAVGGYVQAIPANPLGTLTAWMNEEGKLHDLPYNEKATQFLAPGLFASDWIAGACIFTGGYDDEGNTIPLSAEDIENFKGLFS